MFQEKKGRKRGGEQKRLKKYLSYDQGGPTKRTQGNTSALRTVQNGLDWVSLAFQHMLSFLKRARIVRSSLDILQASASSSA